MNGPLTCKFPVTEVLDAFRSSLAALVPVVERLAIPWTDGDAYDDWDDIASTLFKQLVVNTCQNAIEVGGTHEFAKYDLIYPSYETLAHFEVVSKHTSKVFGVFVGFAGVDRDFTMVKHSVRGLDGTFDTNTTHNELFSECQIRLRLPSAENEYVEVLTMAD